MMLDSTNATHSLIIQSAASYLLEERANKSSNSIDVLQSKTLLEDISFDVFKRRVNVLVRTPPRGIAADFFPFPKPVALLTCEGYESYKEDDVKIIKAFKQQGFVVEPVIWNNPSVNWSKYQKAIVRSTWDYCKGNNFEKFLETLQKIESLGINLLNPFKTIRWNTHKAYLKDLEELGISCIETVFIAKKNLENIQSIINEKKWSECVIKPVISSGGTNTFRFKPPEIEIIIDKCKQTSILEWMLQPFMNEIVEEGEWSFVVLGKKCVKAVLKKPAPLNFLVHDWYGGVYQSVTPFPWMIEKIEKIITAINSKFPTIYARIDVVRHGKNFRIMEVEAVEPFLFFQNSKALAQYFSHIMILSDIFI
jgi:glutathione synthase/RimK-type ligase-like ATP-grasp enzyme